MFNAKRRKRHTALTGISLQPIEAAAAADQEETNKTQTPSVRVIKKKTTLSVITTKGLGGCSRCCLWFTWVNEPNIPPKPTVILIHPRSPFAVFWSALIFVLVAVLVFTLPVEIGFVNTIPPGSEIVSFSYSIFVVIAFYLDILVNFCCAYANKERTLIMNPKKIAIHYLNGWLILDIISTVPSSILMLNIDNHSVVESSLNLFKVLKLLRLSKSIVAFRAFTSLRRNESGILNWCAKLSLTRFHPSTKRLMTLMLVASLVLHWYACMWHFIGEISQIQDLSTNTTATSWIDVAVDNQFFESALSDRYIWSLYWSTTTLTTVGYGDISATNSIEAGFLVFVLMSGVFFYATLLGSVAEHIGTRDPIETESRKRSEALSTFIITSKLPLNIAMGLWENHRKNVPSLRRKFIDESTIELMNSFTPKLRAATILHVYRWHLSKIPFFNRNIASVLEPPLENSSSFSFSALDSSVYASDVVQGLANALRQCRYLHVHEKQMIVCPEDLFTHVYFVSGGSITIEGCDLDKEKENAVVATEEEIEKEKKNNRKQEQQEQKEKPEVMRKNKTKIQNLIAKPGDVLGVVWALTKISQSNSEMQELEFGHANFSIQPTRGTGTCQCFSLSILQMVELYDCLPREMKMELCALDRIQLNKVDTTTTTQQQQQLQPLASNEISVSLSSVEGGGFNPLYNRKQSNSKSLMREELMEEVIEKTQQKQQQQVHEHRVRKKLLIKRTSTISKYT